MKILFIYVLMLIVSKGFSQNAGSPFSGNAQNPGIFVAADLIGNVNLSDQTGYFGVQSLELGISAPLDPFARVDVTLHQSAFEILSHNHADTNTGHAHGSGFALEEALITLTTLPGGFQFSAGRMRSRIGMANVIHLHDFNFTLFPQLVTTYWGEEGLSVDGGRLSWLAPLPVWMELVIEGQSLFNQEGTDFLTAGLNIFLPLGDYSGLSLTGFSFFDQQKDVHPLYSLFHEEDLTNTTVTSLLDNQIFGLNGWGSGLRFKWKKAYTSLILQGEFQGRKLGQVFYQGFYVFAELGFRRFNLGLMYQNTQVPHFHETEGVIEADRHQALNLSLSYFLSEFQRMRLHYVLPLTAGEDGLLEHQLYLQWTMILGPHKPHAY